MMLPTTPWRFCQSFDGSILPVTCMQPKPAEACKMPRDEDSGRERVARLHLSERDDGSVDR